MSLLHPVNFWTLSLGVYLYYALWALFGAISTFTIIGLTQEVAHHVGRTTLWCLVILGVPIFGAAAYLLTQPAAVSRQVRRCAAWCTILAVVALGALVLLLVWSLGPTPTPA